MATTSREDDSWMGPPLLADAGTAIPPRPDLPREGWVRGGVLLGTLALLVTFAGSFGLWDCWETHYGEVARYMHEMGDLLSPWWGYKDQIGTEAKTGEWFFSKPILIMYGEILFFKLIGVGEWAVRLPWALLGTLGVFFSYVTFARIFGRWTGLLAAGMLLTTPLYFFLSRQAITDMPFVGTLTVGLLFFLNAYLGPRFQASNRAFLGWIALAVGWFLLLAVPQFIIIGLDLEPEGTYDKFGTVMRAWLLVQKTGWVHTALYLFATGITLALIGVPLYREWKAGTLFSEDSKDRWLRRACLWTAYVFLGLATLGKGLLGFMLPGAILALYLLLTGEWKALRRMEILRGVLMLCLVMLPWYLGMFAKHGNAFYTRFLVHDHFNRLGAGVHQIDTGTFEHFIKWGAIATFPWVGMLPLVIGDLIRLRLRDDSPRSRMRLFLLIWSFFSYLLFTLSATKFHHYIFPAIPPFVLLAALSVEEALDHRGWSSRLALVAGAALVVAVGYTIATEPQSFRNMFTYKYDRPWPEHPPTDASAPVATGSQKTWADSTFYRKIHPVLREILQVEALQYDRFVPVVVGLAAGLFVAMAFASARLRRWFFRGLWGIGLALLLWCLNWYMPMLSPSWSVKYVFDDYFDRCEPAPQEEWVREAYTPILTRLGLGFIPEALGSHGKRVCKEDVIAWLITWRGETYYTQSEIKPLMKATQLAPYLETLYPGGPIYAMTQAGRGSGLESALNRETEALKKKGVGKLMGIRKWKVEVIHEESAYFSLAIATPVKEEGAGEEAPATAAGPEDETPDVPPAGM